MSKRVAFGLLLAVMVAAESQADGRFNWRKGVIRPFAARRVPVIRQRALLTPEVLTERFGPSVLIRESVATKKKSKFVTQP